MEEKLEEVVEETTLKINQGDPGDEHVEKVDESKFESAGDDSVLKVDLSNPPAVEEEVVEDETTTNEEVTEVTETKEPELEVETETPVLEEITIDGEDQEAVVEATQEEVDEAIAESEATGEPLPENIQKLMDFMDETGGDLDDYVKLNQDYSKLDDKNLLYEYYKQTKPHLNNEEINFLMEDSFSYDEEVDEERDIRRKKLALKEQVASAKAHLDGQKSKYYEEIKAGSKLTQEQQKAVNFFNRYNKESEANQKIAESQKSTFLKKTEQVFNNKFKGFEYNVGDKRYRFNIKDANKVKETQSDINNFVKKFLNKNNEMSDAKGYHKSLFTAMNPDAVAKHFYEQGKADALKTSIDESKNIDMKPRQELNNNFDSGGYRARVIGESTADFKFKIKNKK